MSLVNKLTTRHESIQKFDTFLQMTNYFKFVDYFIII